MIALLFAQPAAIEPAAALDRLEAAYAETAVADMLTFETSRRDGTFDAVTATLRIDPDADAIRYDTAGFAFHASPGTLTGIDADRDDPRRVLTVDEPGVEPGELLTSVVPTGPLPQLWRAERDEVVDPSVGVIRFTSAEQREITTVISGVSAFGTVFVELDRDTGRLITLRAALRDGSLELRAAPAEPGDPKEWAIDMTGLRPVQRIDQLAPALPRLAEGDVFPDLRLLTAEAEGRDLSEWHESPSPGAPRAPWSVLLIADATGQPPEAALASARSHLDRIASAALRRRADSPAEQFWLRFRPLIVVVMPEDFALAEQRRIDPPAGTDVLISTRPHRTIDRLPVSETVAIAIDRDRIIGAIGVGTGDAAVGSFIDAMLRPASNPPTGNGSPD